MKHQKATPWIRGDYCKWAKTFPSQASKLLCPWDKVVTRKVEGIYLAIKSMKIWNIWVANQAHENKRLRVRILSVTMQTSQMQASQMQLKEPKRKSRKINSVQTGLLMCMVWKTAGSPPFANFMGSLSTATSQNCFPQNVLSLFPGDENFMAGREHTYRHTSKILQVCFQITAINQV